MTSARLVRLVRMYPLIREIGLRIENDEIYEYGSYAQEELLRECEFLEASGQLTFVVGQEVYTSSDAAFLASVHRVLEPMMYNDATKGIIKKADKEWVDYDRQRVAAGGGKALPPKFFYSLKTNPISIGFWSVPEAADVVNVRYVRRHKASDNISASVDPLIPDDYEKIMTLGTVYQFFEHYLHKYRREFDVVAPMYENAKSKFKVQRMMSTMARKKQTERLLW